jgi:tagatose 1,6-diphosphate aldolase GatY/KbaY
MPLVNFNQLLNAIKEQNVIAPAFNTTNLEMTLAIMDGLEESGYPGMIQIAPTNVKLSGYSYIADIVKRAEDQYKVPMCLHLDHGRTFEDVQAAVEAGFNSVMIDGSSLPYEENIQLTKRVVDYCKDFGVAVEAELGAIVGKEDDHVNLDDAKTDPALVRDFVERSGCDLLAVSVGNIHGLDGVPEIDFELLEKLKQESPVPLVIHGGSGIPLETVKLLREYNVVKMNIASDLRKVFISTVGEFYEANHNEYNLIKVLLSVRENLKEAVCLKTKQLNY